MLGICLRSRPWVPRCLIYWTSLWFVSLTDCCMCSKPWSMWRPRQLQWCNCWNCFWLRCSKRGHIWGILIPIYLELLNGVAQIGPIAISVDASTWHAYDGGIYNGCNQTTSDIDHAVFWLVMVQATGLSATPGLPPGVKLAISNFIVMITRNLTAPLMWHLWTEQLVLAKLIQSQPVVPAASFMTQLILLT
jgi:hypothetical protein